MRSLFPPGNKDEIFTVTARRCKRCGGLLTSKEAVSEGYGHVCKQKMLGEENANKPIDGQMSFMDKKSEEGNP